MTANEVGLPSIAETEAVPAASIPYEGTDCTADEAAEAVKAVRAAAALATCPTHAVCPPCREGWGHWNGHEYVPTTQSKAAAPSVYVSHECYGDRHDDCAWPRCECGCHRGS